MPMFCSLRRAVAWAVALALAGAVPAAAQQPAHIRSPGPLTDIALGGTLGCQVTVQGSGMYWHPDQELAACGTFLSVAGADLWGPADAHRVVEREPFEPVSQSPVMGTGTAADPYRVFTEVRLGPAAGQFAGVRLRERVFYVTGETSYVADVTVINTSRRSLSFMLYHAADCHLPGGGFFGVSYGFARTGVTIPPSTFPVPLTWVGCSEHPDDTPTGARQALIPTTLGDFGYSYTQGFYASVWEQLNAGDVLSRTVSENVQWDTAMAVGWLYEGLPAGVSAQLNYRAAFELPPSEPEPPTEPKPPTQPKPPTEPETPAGIVIRDPIFVPAPGDSVDVVGRCRTRPGGRCFVELGSGRQRRSAVVRDGRLVRLGFVLGAAARGELRRDCATELALRVAVYQPAGRRARVGRRTVQVLCARLRGRCAAAPASVLGAGRLASPVAALARRAPPRARIAC